MINIQQTKMNFEDSDIRTWGEEEREAANAYAVL